MTAQEKANSPLLYEGAVVSDSSFGLNVSVGQWSTVRNSVLGDQVSIQRFNAIDSCEIGNFTYTGRYTTILHAKIGSFSSISWGISIGGADHDLKKVTTHDFLYNPMKGLLPEGYIVKEHFKDDCIVGNDVWIGANASILRGVTIGDGAVIGAGSVVTRDVEPYSVVVGSPAKTIKKRFKDDVIERLLKVKWWDFPTGAIRNHFDLFNNSPERTIEELEAIRAEINKR